MVGVEVEAPSPLVDVRSPAPFQNIAEGFLRDLPTSRTIQDVVDLYKSRANPVRYELELDGTLPPFAAADVTTDPVFSGAVLAAADQDLCLRLADYLRQHNRNE